MKKVVGMSLVVAVTTGMVLSVGGVMSRSIAIGVGCPVSAPVSFPISYAKLYEVSGRVRYAWMNMIQPGWGTMVEATNRSNNQKTTVSVAKNGAYTLKVPCGQYGVRAFDLKGTRFVPNVREIMVAGRVRNLDFWGWKRGELVPLK